MRATESRESKPLCGGARRQDKPFEKQILEEVEEEEAEEEAAKLAEHELPGESTPALEALIKRKPAPSEDQLVAESKYSSKVQFRAPDIIEL